MTRSVACEAALLTDAVNRAARISPSKGPASAKTQGIQIEVRPGSNRELTVYATDIESSFWTRLGTTEVGDEHATWRLPSRLLSGFLSGLPNVAGKTVTLSEEANGIVLIKAGRARVRLRTIPDDLPEVRLFDPSGMSSSANFGQRVGQVAWAAAREADSRPALQGVHITGKILVAADGITMAFLPCDVPIDEPITAPLGKLSSVLRNTLDVRVRATETQLQIMPDTDTQMTCALFQTAYPNVDHFRDIDPPNKFEIAKPDLVEALGMQLVLASEEQVPRMRLTIGESLDELHFSMHVTEVGEVANSVPINCVKHNAPGPFAWTVDPSRFLEAVKHASREVITLHVADEPALRVMRFTDDSEYDAILSPTSGVEDRAAAKDAA